jgi:thiol-disulfide isomerase/thioredoxin
MIKLCYILIILLAALMIKLYLDSKGFSPSHSLGNNNSNSNTNNDLESDPTFKKLLEQIKSDTERKINVAVEEGFADGYKEMLEQDDNIVSYLNKNNSVKLMLFYKMECPHCQSFMPTWNRIINNLPNNVEYEEIECNKQSQKANENNISSVPTIILVVNNEKKIYMGDRSYQDINRFMRLNGVNIVERTFEQFDSTGYSSDPSPTIAPNPHCPAVTFDKQVDLAADSYMFQIFNADGQYGYAKGATKVGSVFTPFTAAYSAVDSYLSSLPNPSNSTLSSTANINECASLYANQIKNFDLCDKEQLDKILSYQTNVSNNLATQIFDGTDYSTNIKTVNAIKKACNI